MLNMSLILFYGFYCNTSYLKQIVTYLEQLFFKDISEGLILSYYLIPLLPLI